MSRLGYRLRTLSGAVAGRGRRAGARPASPDTVLVLHALLLGDTLMLAPLLARLRRRHPSARILVTAHPAVAPLFAARPYGVEALAWHERLADAWARLAPARGADLVLLPGDNRHAVAARALGARWVAGFAGTRERWLDEVLPWPASPASLADIFALLAGPEDGARHAAGDWPAPPAAPFERPAGRYAVLHPGAGSVLRHWAPERWRALAEALEAEGLAVVWSAGPHETGLVARADPDGRRPSYAGRLDLAQLWHLLAGAALLVAPDTGVSHLAKLAGTPAVTLYGPGSPALFGRGGHFRDAPFAAAGRADFPCRDQRTLFRRELDWVRRCQRTPAECPRARCMEAIGVDEVLALARTVIR